MKTLSKDCNFKAIDTEAARDEHIMDAFINGLRNVQVRQRLFEIKTMTLRTAYNIANNLELTQIGFVFFLTTVCASQDFHGSSEFSILSSASSCDQGSTSEQAVITVSTKNASSVNSLFTPDIHVQLETPGVANVRNFLRYINFHPSNKASQ